MALHTFTAGVLLIVDAALGSGPGLWQPAASEEQNIKALIQHIEELKDAVFVRNDVEYDAKTAAEFLRRKWKANAGDVKTAQDFLDKVAGTSSTSGKPYVIRFKDGTEKKSKEYLSSVLAKLEKP